MSNSENVCVGCKHPIVDETIKGDMTLRDDIRIHHEKLVVGAHSGCRNCAVILDAITTVDGNETPTSPRFEYNISQSQGLTIYSNPPFEIQVFRCSKDHQDLEHRSSGTWNVKELRALSTDTRSQETFRIIQDWRTNCMKHHERCLQGVASPLPKRILEIGTTRIYLKEQPGNAASYACLSHCWGPDGPALKLGADTANSLRMGLVLSDLPKTFRDTVEVCRHLGIRYLWIDALCILQDNEEDWKEAAATMASIYENSHVTIAATASQNSDDGLFSSKRPFLRRLNKHPDLYVHAYSVDFPTSACEAPKSMPLLGRAWVYQERRLSPRTIHFGENQVYWECQTHFASEDAREERTWTSYTAEFLDHVCYWGDRVQNPTLGWHKIVTEYTNLQLTYESDRLPAIAALADRTSRRREVDDVYIAGIWKNSMLPDLLWTRLPDTFVRWRDPRPPRMAPSWGTAPSWSWASTQNHNIKWDSYAFTENTTAANLEYTVVGAANLGEVINASVTLRVPVLDLTSVDEIAPVCLDDLNHGERFRDRFRSSSSKQQFEQFNLRVPICRFVNDYDLTLANPPYVSGRTIKLLAAGYHGARIGGIVVQQTLKNAFEYERIGFLEIPVEKTRDPGRIHIHEELEVWLAEMEARTHRLILSLPMEEVKIV